MPKLNVNSIAKKPVTEITGKGYINRDTLITQVNKKCQWENTKKCRNTQNKK
jgi:hypothetical protein